MHAYDLDGLKHVVIAKKKRRGQPEEEVVLAGFAKRTDARAWCDQYAPEAKVKRNV